MSELTPEDIAAARAQGDIAALLLMASGLPVKAAKPRPAAEPPPAIQRARPGAWPAGTRSPGPTPEVAEYLARLWPDRFTPNTEEDQ